MKVGVAVVVLATLLAVGPLLSRAKQTSTHLAHPETIKVEEEWIQGEVLATGTLRPLSSTVVGAQVSGTIVELGASFNDRVVKGQVLARLDPAGFLARSDQAEAQLESAEAQEALARDSLERNKSLVGQGFISQSALRQSEIQLQVASAGVRTARAQLNVARVDLKNTVITAPISGVVLSKNVEVGQTISAALQTPDLFTLAPDLKAMRIVASIREADLPKVPQHGKVTFSVDAYPRRSFEGEIQQVRMSDSVTQGAVTYPLIIAVVNDEGVLRPGMTAEVRIKANDGHRALVLPIAALRFKPRSDVPASASEIKKDQARVYVQTKDGKIEARLIRLGSTYGDRVEVLAGALHTGELVATSNEPTKD